MVVAVILGIIFCIWFFVKVIIPITKGFVEAAANVVGAIFSVAFLVLIGAIIANL